MKYGRELLAALGFLAAGAASHPASAGYPAAYFDLVGVTFDDGGQVTGGFDFNIANLRMPLPQYYNIQIATSAGSTLTGSYFSSAKVCYNRMKRFSCAPGDDFVMYLETGTQGEPGFDHLQLATEFAPNAGGIGNFGVLDPVASYEIGCTESGCFVRHITSGAIRWGTLL